MPVVQAGHTDNLPDDPQVFQANLRELARDLVIKEQQIEYLIKVLPGIGNSAKEQNERIKQLEQELSDVEEERRQAAVERDQLLAVVEELAMGCRRIH